MRRVCCKPYPYSSSGSLASTQGEEISGNNEKDRSSRQQAAVSAMLATTVAREQYTQVQHLQYTANGLRFETGNDE